MPERMPDRTPDRMSEDMSDKMPERLPDSTSEHRPDRMQNVRIVAREREYQNRCQMMPERMSE